MSLNPSLEERLNEPNFNYDKGIDLPSLIKDAALSFSKLFIRIFPIIGDIFLYKDLISQREKKPQGFMETLLFAGSYAGPLTVKYMLFWSIYLMYRAGPS